MIIEPPKSKQPRKCKCGGNFHTSESMSSATVLVQRCDKCWRMIKQFKATSARRNHIEIQEPGDEY